MSAIGLLGVVLVVLKALGLIGMSWWWATLPFWGGFALWLAFIVFALVMAAITGQTR